MRIHSGVRVLVLLLVSGSYGVFSEASAEPARPDGQPACEAPLSTCQFGRVADPLGAVAEPADTCPDGYRCSCVPSCPECDDCDAQVCVKDPSGIDCEARRAKATRAVRHVVEKFGFCRTASDCIQIDDSTRCGGTCGAFVNERVARRASRKIDRIDQKFCDGFGLDGCPVLFPGCLAGVQPACVENRCVGIFSGPDPIPLP